ncbi:MAG TPA: glycosyltransferase [Thermoanaerobaculia bacterium]|jgi:glycosyltransferase involved in cell wall biosynthesis|nr:glycosyltransferase [Thermoanaerobaculia bacterium]
MTRVNACTIVSNNYLALAQVFAASYKSLHPGAEVYVCIADRPDPSVHYGRLPFVPVFAAELGIPAFENFAFRYDILELNTAVKPFLLDYLRKTYGLDRIFYFDPDILVLDSVAPLERLLDEHPAVLIPHITRGLDDGLLPPERMILMAGVYNLGFLGLRLDETTAEFLSWWQDRLYRFCVNDIHNGVFVDQSWMDLAPAFLDDVAIVRDPIYNIAYWNLPHRRTVWDGEQLTAEGRPIGFFHFSGIDFDNLEAISKHQNRVSLTRRPELRPLFERYRRLVREAGHAQLVGIPYGFRSFPGTEVTVPWVARRLLQRMDPKGRRWPNPYDIYSQDSFFAWLVEPIPYPGGTLNRAVLALWELRDDLVRAFPEVCGRDLRRYVHWLKLHGEGVRAGLHPIFLEPVGARDDPALVQPRHSTFGPQLHPYATVAVERAAELLARLDLTRPGAMTAWLNEPIPGTAARNPVVTRLVLLLWKVRADVQQNFPDPLEGHQAQLADWFCRHAASEFYLHPDLVAPVLRTLPRKTRMALAWRREAVPTVVRPPARIKTASTAAPEEAPGEPSDAPAVAAEGASPKTAAASEPLGGRRALTVNLAGYFGMDTGVGQVARGSLLALARAGIDAQPVPLDQDLPSRTYDGRVCYEEGVPHPVTILHANADETPRALSTLPIAGTAGGVKIGYWFWELSHFPLALTDRFGLLDEVWAPSRFCQQSYEPVATVPIRYVPPCVPAPGETPATAANRARFGIEPGRFTFFFAFDVLSVPERKNPFAAIEAVRRLARRTSRPFALLLKVSRARHDAALLARLSEAARGLPVEIHTTPASREEMDALVSLCDANLSLHRSEGLGLLPIETLYLGKPVVATGYGGVTDFLDETTGFPVGHTLVRLERDHTPYPAGAVWAEPDLDHAADQMLRVLEDPDEAAARGAAGRARVEALYGVEAAAARFAQEIERVYGQLYDGPATPPAQG